MEESHTCDNCNKSFSTKGYLKKHKNSKSCVNSNNCPKCGKEFASKGNLNKHLRKKVNCIPDAIPVIIGNNEENKCHMCGKTYASASNLRRHQDACNVKNNPDVLIQLVEQNKKLMGIIEKNGFINQVNNITINNTQNNLYMNVTIVPFGDEDYSKLDVDKVMDLVKNHSSEFMPKMIENIYANPNRPEYHNVVYDKQRKMAIKFTAISADTKTWIGTDAKAISDQITSKIRTYMHPLNSPYYNSAVKDLDYETANQVINIATSGEDTFEKNLESLEILSKNEQFKALVGTVD